MTHQDQVTCHVLSNEAFFFSSANVPRETLHCANSFTVFGEDGPSEVLLEKDPASPPSYIQNWNAPTSAPGESIEAVIFNASNQTEHIALVTNQGLEVDDDI